MLPVNAFKSAAAVAPLTVPGPLPEGPGACMNKAAAATISTAAAAAAKAGRIMNMCRMLPAGRVLKPE